MDPTAPPPNLAATPAPAEVVPLEHPEAEPTTPVARPRYAVWHFVTVVTGMLLGVSILLLAHKYFAARIFPAPVVAANFELVTTPNADFTASLIGMALR